MTIASQFGRIAHGFRPGLSLEGQPVEGLEVLARPRINPHRREIWTATIGGTASDGAYTLRIVGDDGTDFTTSWTRGAAEANAAIATALGLAVMAKAERKGVVLSATPASTALAIRMKHAGRAYTVTGTAPGAGTIALVETLSHEGVELPVGRFVIGATLEDLAALALPTNSIAKTDVIGVVARPHTGLARPVNAVPSADVVHPVGRMVGACVQGIFALRNNGSVASAQHGAVHVVRNTAGGQARGMARSDADSTNTIALDLTQARWLEATAAGELGPVLVTL